MRVDFDLETRSRVNLKTTNVYKYAECPDFRVLMGGFSIDGGPAYVVEGHEDTAHEFQVLWDRGATFRAHNANFDRVCMSVAVGLPAFTYLDPDRFDDTAVIASEYGLPRSLEPLAIALGVTPKDTAGKALIRLFCVPNRKGGWNDATTHSEEWERFKRYCGQDVDTMVEAAAKMPSWPTPVERAAWVHDALVNDRGIPVDLDLAAQAEAAAKLNLMMDEIRVMELTGIRNPKSVHQLKAWTVREGIDKVLPNFQAATVELALAEADLTDVQRDVLLLRQELALSSASKFSAALRGANSDGRLRGQLQFFGAHTGRWAGRGMNYQNLPRAAFKTDVEVESALLDLRLGFGAAPLTLKKLVRPLILGPITVVDFSSIEARILAWISGEQWVCDAFAEGRDIYTETANRFGPEFTRQQGKTAVLACGYAGGVSAMRRMGAEGEDEELQILVDAWREANPNSVKLWKTFTSRFAEGGKVGKFLAVKRIGGSMRMLLPSGRAIHYHGVKHENYTVPAPTLEEPERRQTKSGWRYKDPNSANMRKGYHSGTATENACQAIARDILVEAMLRLEEHGYKVIGSVHDEVIVEGIHDVEEVARIMCISPAWGDGLPLNAEGYATDYRYHK